MNLLVVPSCPPNYRSLKYNTRVNPIFVPVRNRIPLFIRYFTCDVVDDEIVFYEDVYGDDRRLKDKFFANKN